MFSKTDRSNTYKIINILNSICLTSKYTIKIYTAKFVIYILSKSLIKIKTERQMKKYICVSEGNKIKNAIRRITKISEFEK